MLTNLPHIVVARGRQARMKGGEKVESNVTPFVGTDFGRFRVSSWPRSPLSFLLLLADQHSSRFVPVLLSVTRAIIVNTSRRDIFCINSKKGSSRENHHSSRFIDSSIRYWIIYFLRYLRKFFEMKFSICVHSQLWKYPTWKNTVFQNFSLSFFLKIDRDFVQNF